MTTYVGRFAPSPTGPLHQGSLIAALASFLDARANNGRWLLRIEDLDPPREMAGAVQSIMQSLRDHGLHWDDEVMWQSRRHSAYRAALRQLLECGAAFYCTCSRTDLAPFGGIYPGTCRGCSQVPAGEFAVRLQVADTAVGFVDAVQGECSQSLPREVGDFVLLRKDGLFAYQLAVVVDDAAQGITHVVRGADLLDSTPRQIWLQRQLGLPTPAYAHIPVLTNAEGQKLSKQTFAPQIDPGSARDNLLAALSFLNQPLPRAAGSPEDVLAQAVANWDLQRVPHRLQISQADPGADR